MTILINSVNSFLIIIMFIEYTVRRVIHVAHLEQTYRKIQNTECMMALIWKR